MYICTTIYKVDSLLSKKGKVERGPKEDKENTPLSNWHSELRNQDQIY